MRRVSCDVCKFATMHDYVPNHYYCGKRLFIDDGEPRSNCEEKIDKYKFLKEVTSNETKRL